MIGFMVLILLDAILIFSTLFPFLRRHISGFYRQRRGHASPTNVEAGKVSSNAIDSDDKETKARMSNEEENRSNQYSASPALFDFVASVSRCIGVDQVGLSFGFENLGLVVGPHKKPILSGLTGHIGSGSLWGILGSSGAGKCERPNSTHENAQLIL